MARLDKLVVEVTDSKKGGVPRLHSSVALQTPRRRQRASLWGRRADHSNQGAVSFFDLPLHFLPFPLVAAHCSPPSVLSSTCLPLRGPQ